MKNQIMIYGADIQLDRLSKLGDPLEKLNAAIDWEIFRAPTSKTICGSCKRNRELDSIGIL